MDFCQMIPPSCRHLFSILLSAVIFYSPAAMAQTPEVSSSEDVAIAFFKTADTNPDFDLWAKGSKEYNRQSATRAEEFLYEEKQRLIKEWKAYDPDENLLTVKANVTLELKAVADKDGNEKDWMYISFPEGHITYFPYVFQDYKIAVIPQKIESLMIQPISKEQFQLMRTDFDDKLAGPAVIYISLKPAKAYIHQPYEIDGTEQWALLSDIVSMSLSSFKQTQTPYWNYGADWYVSPKTKELRNLYQNGGGSSMPMAPQ